MASKKLKRHYIGFEIEPKYYNIAINRVNDITPEESKTGQMNLFDFEE